MCGRYALNQTPQQMQELFDFTDLPNFPPRYNIAPTQPVPIVRIVQGRRRFALVRWGLVPSWAKEFPKGAPLINARGETIKEKPSFRGGFRHRRCLMPADGFYEWRRGEGPPQPFMVRRKDRAPFAMAAIWEDWMGVDGSEVETCAIVTTSANDTLKPIHHRMPVILDPEDWKAWLDTDDTLVRDAAQLLKPAPDDLLEAFPVSPDVNKVANDEPHLMDPAEPIPPRPAPPEKPQLDLF